ncbi:MAG: type II secretion system protein J [Phycisphaerales bacterium]
MRQPGDILVSRRRTPGALLAAAGRTAPGSGRESAPSFTLIEVMIAVGAVALIGVALASVFSQTSRTITVGKRVSALNAYAGMLEQQMRLDFSRVSRDGYLVIHNQLADSNRVADFQYNGPAGVNTAGVQDVVALHADDLAPRPRRIDEVVIFVEGDAASARDPLSPSNLARGNASRVYYGHGKRRIADQTAQGTLYLRPELDDDNDEAEANLGVAPPAIPITVTNPNRYASDWVLLRFATVLAPPRSTTMTYQNVGPPTSALADRDEQVGFQPAASNLFRALNIMFPNPGQVPAPQFPFGDAIRGDVRPQFTSGLVDLATTTLSEIRSIVTTADTWPGSVPTGGSGSAAGLNFFDPMANMQPDGGGNAGPDGKFRIHGTGPGQDPQLIWRTQAWMIEGLPAWSHANDPNQRTRVRCEPEPPAYLAPTDPGHPLYSTLPDHLRYARRADQLMLSSSNFLPRCTEFIVEWTFGASYPSDTTDPNYRAGREGEVIWHGMARREDGVPIQPAATQAGLEDNPQIVAQPYNPGTADVQLHRAKFRRIDGTLASYPNVAAEVQLATELIHGQGVPLPYVPPAGTPIVSYFGYVDPTFNPDRGGAVGYGDPSDSATTTIPWAWPRLVRVTIGLADPTDPTIEQRFQFVFELPPNQEP